MVLTAISCSPRRRIRLVTVVGELTACPRPVGPTCLRQLDTSNGCQDHTALPAATTSFVCAPLTTHGSFANPPCDSLRARRCRVHRIPSRVRDDRDTPLWGTRRRGV